MKNKTVENYFTFKVKEGKKERYEEILAEQLAITKNEPETLSYKIFKTDDGIYFQNEKYASEEACVTHMKNTEKQLQEWFQITEILHMIMTGPLSKEFREAYNLKSYLPYAEAK
ncbi:MAG: antibiotic biosynthesis monooxygenase [Chitinophagaceae bacterium]|nr:antibiotic biosynthesis monooxygenase [Chitinophagaceae bacterium]